MCQENIPEHFRERIKKAKEQQLEELDLSSYRNIYDSQKLTRIPDEVFELTNLTTLDLSDNQLTTLPESITNLSNLTRLDLTNNQLNNLPESIGNLSNLTRLDLSGNQLTTLPESITNLSNLTRLDLSHNPLEKPPLEVAENGIKAIREYFRQLKEEGKDYIYEAKLLIVGEGGAGKTTLAKKIENPQYQLDINEPSTEGINIIKWSFSLDNEREFKVNIWDFGGQEIYHATHQFFLTKHSLYTLVADTRKEDTDFYYWLNRVELLSNNSPLLIIKNEKGDRTIEIDVNSLRGRFENLKESLATNLKTNRGLENIINNIKFYIQQLPHIGQTLPKSWVKVRQTLESDSRNYISLNEYFDICEKNGLNHRQDKLQLSQYLHDLGVCLHFQDNKNSPLYKIVILNKAVILNKVIIIKPEWPTEAVYKVLDNQNVIKNKGYFSYTDIEHIWQESQYTDMQGELLALMMRFKLCYQIPGTNDTYIAPQLLNKTKPNYDWNEADNLILRYTYEFMPKGIITQLIVAMHQHIYQQRYVWRSGVLLDKDNTLAEVIEYYDKREIKIKVSGKRKKDLLTIITHELDKIHHSYQRLKYRKLIPCNCSECHNQPEPYFHPFDVLQKAKEKGQREVQCQKSFQMVNVLNLIDDVIIQHKSKSSDSTRNAPQPITKIEQHFYNQVGTATGTIEGNLGDTNMEGDRHISIDKGNYNERIEGDYIEGNKSDRSRNINISDNAQVTASGAGAFSLGDISGTVANTLNQLPNFDNEPHKKELKELLSQLQTAVPETDLDDEDKQETLEQINSIAQALLDNQNRKLKRKAKGAIPIIQDIATALPSDKPLVAICNQLPDLMGQVF